MGKLEKMKPITGIVTAILIATIARSNIARAENAPPVGRFSGGGYSIDLGSSGEYLGSDRSRRRILIPRNRQRSSGNTSEWENDGYIYRVSGVGNSLAESNTKPTSFYDPTSSKDYRQVALTILNPSGRIILYKILNNSRYVKK
jgi:hypothetical protein